jgi:prevent-host-death family protein
MQMNVAEAKAKLSELVAAAERGEEVVIARGGTPVVRLVPAAGQGVRLGALRGVVPADSLPDFLEPMSAEDLAEWGA